MFIPLSMFDPAPYQHTPQLPLRGLCTLGEALIDLTPAQAPDYIHAGAARLGGLVKGAQDAMLARMRESDEATMVSDTVFDAAVDSLWRLLSSGLRRWSSYGHPGLVWLESDAQLEGEVDVEALRAKVARAEELDRALFSVEGPDMLTRRFHEQVQTTARWLELIDADGLEDELAQLCGPELVPILRRCQVHYDNMVKTRAARETASRADLRIARSVLQRAIVRYCGLVLNLVEDDDPKSIERVERALRPMINLRVARSGASGASAEAEELEQGEELSQVPGEELAEGPTPSQVPGEELEQG